MRASLYRDSPASNSWKGKVQAVNGSMNLSFGLQGEIICYSDTGSCAAKAYLLQGCLLIFQLPLSWMGAEITLCILCRLVQDLSCYMYFLSFVISQVM